MIVAKKTHQGCVLEEKKTGLLALLISVQQMFYFIIHLFVVWNVKWWNYYIVISRPNIHRDKCIHSYRNLLKFFANIYYRCIIPKKLMKLFGTKPKKKVVKKTVSVKFFSKWIYAKRRKKMAKIFVAKGTLNTRLYDIILHYYILPYTWLKK